MAKNMNKCFQYLNDYKELLLKLHFIIGFLFLSFP